MKGLVLANVGAREHEKFMLPAETWGMVNWDGLTLEGHACPH